MTINCNIKRDLKTFEKSKVQIQAPKKKRRAKGGEGRGTGGDSVDSQEAALFCHPVGGKGGTKSE